MENYLLGVISLVSEGRAITGVRKHGDDYFIRADTLVETYETISRGIMLPETKHTITYDAKELDDIKSIELDSKRNPTVLNEENAFNYVRMDKIRDNLENFVDDYEHALAEGTTPVTKTDVYKATRSKSIGPDWCYVVTKLVTVPTRPDEVGELNELADMDFSLEEKQDMFPQYDLISGQPNGQEAHYVSIGSVWDQIQSLKGEEQIVLHRIAVNGMENV